MEEGLLWPGWNTLEILPADVSGGVKVTFPKIEAPGRFVLGQWEDDPELGMRIGVTVDGAKTEPGAVDLPAFTHAHPLWIFNAEGVYRITMQMTATLPSGATVSDRETLAVVVGDDVDPGTVVPGDGTNPTSTPTLTPTPTPTPSTASPSVTPTPTPTTSAPGSPSATPTEPPAPTGSPSATTTSTPSATGAPAPSFPSGGGGAITTAPTGGGGRLASTGAGVALPMGIAAAALAAGVAAVVVVRRKRGVR